MASLSTHKPPKPTHTPRSSTRSAPFTQILLSRAHSPQTAARILADKIAHKPLILYANRTTTTTTTGATTPHNARTARRHQRAQKALSTRRKRRKPAPLSAAQKRALGVHDIPAAERRWALYAGLNALWQGYMREILGVARGSGRTGVTVAGAGPKIAGADLHGAEVECVRSACVDRVGVRGVVVRDTKFTFVVVTRRDEVKVLPKEGSWFRIEVVLEEEEEEEEEGTGGDGVGSGRQGGGVGGSEDREGKERKRLVFELQGEQFKNRAPERAKKKFKMHLPVDL